MRILRTDVQIYPSGYGYGVTISVKLDGRATPLVIGAYSSLSWGELEDVLGVELQTLRPGWAVGQEVQDSLWEGAGDLLNDESPLRGSPSS